MKLVPSGRFLTQLLDDGRRATASKLLCPLSPSIRHHRRPTTTATAIVAFQHHHLFVRHDWNWRPNQSQPINCRKSTMLKLPRQPGQVSKTQC